MRASLYLNSYFLTTTKSPILAKTLVEKKILVLKEKRRPIRLFYPR